MRRALGNMTTANIFTKCADRCGSPKHGNSTSTMLHLSAWFPTIVRFGGCLKAIAQRFKAWIGNAGNSTELSISRLLWLVVSGAWNNATVKNTSAQWSNWWDSARIGVKSHFDNDKWLSCFVSEWGEHESNRVQYCKLIFASRLFSCSIERRTNARTSPTRNERRRYSENRERIIVAIISFHCEFRMKDCDAR